METSKPKEERKLSKITALDRGLVAFILLFSLVVIWHTRLGLKGPSLKGAEVAVYHEGYVLKDLRLDKAHVFSFLNGKMLVEIKEGRIRVKESDCLHQICVNTGWIQYPGETVACVPYKVLIEVKSKASPVVDAVVY